MKKKVHLTYNRVLNIILSIGAVFLLYRFFEQKELMKNSTNGKAVVMWTGMKRGKTVGCRQFEYEFIYNQKKYHGTESMLDHNFQVGDTLEIKFSVEAPRISEVLYNTKER